MVAERPGLDASNVKDIGLVVRMHVVPQVRDLSQVGGRGVVGRVPGARRGVVV